ncbi:MAG: PQQ-binding-like beta-propeller repeat protein, partial [Actinobacteria bacterium]|nr:PQQ-binding-like beta-propeller repeat protein [Actinomycetota bacterium]
MPADRALVGAGVPTLLLDDDRDADEAVVAAPRTWSPRARAAAAAAVLLVLVGALVARPEPEVHHEPRGFTERGDAARSGVVSLAPLDTPTGVAWSVDVGAARTSTTVRGAGDLVLERTTGGILAVREAATGAVQWLRRDLGGGGSAMVRAGDVVVTGTVDGHLRGFAVADGVERWTRRGTAVEGLFPVPDGFLSLSQDRLRSIDPATGEARWEVDGPGQLDATIQRVVPGGAGVGLWLTSPPGLPLDSPRVEHRIALLATDTGEVRFAAPLVRPNRDGPLAVGQRFVATADGDGVSVRTPDGRTVHRLRERFGLLAATGDLLAVANPVVGVSGIDLRTGGQRWVRPDVVTDQLVAVDGLVIAGEGTVIDGQTGRTLSQQQRLDPGSVAGEAAVLHLPAIAGTELEVRDRRGATVTRVPLIPDEAAAPAVGAGRVFVPTRDGVEAFAVTDGTRSWSFAQLPTGPSQGGGRPTARTPAVADSTVLVGPGSTFGRGPGLVALALTGGVRIWDREGDQPIVRGPITLAGDTAFLPVGGEIHGYDTATGRRAFAAVTGTARGPLVVGATRVIGGPALRDEVLTATDRRAAEPSTDAVAILRRDRSESWRVPLAPCSGPVLAGATVVWGTPGGVTALDEVTGERVWEVATTRPVCLDPVTAGGAVVVVEDPTTLRAFAVADGGAQRWSTELPAPAVASPVVAGTTLLVPLLDGTLAAYVLADGSPAWTVDLGSVADASPTVLDGRVLVHLRDGRLLALT